MSKPVVLAIILCSIFVALTGCLTSDSDSDYTGVRVGAVLPESGAVETEGTKDDADAGTVPDMTKDEAMAETVAAGKVWTIPDDAQLPGKFYADVADICLRYNKIELAAELFDEALGRETNDEYKSAYYARLAELYSRRKETDKQVESYEKAIEFTRNEPNRKTYYKDLAKLYDKAERYDDAIEAYQYLYDKEEEESKKPGLKRQLYTAYHKAGKINEVKGRFEAELEKDPESKEALEELVFIEFQVTRTPLNAVSYLRKLSDIVPAPDNRKYLNQLSMTYGREGLHDAHAQVMLEILEQLPDNQRDGYMLRLARIYADGEKPAKAAEWAEKVLERQPGESMYLVEAAHIYMKIKSFERADELFEKAISLAPDDVRKQSMLFQYGIASISVDKYDKAEQLFEQGETLVADPMIKLQLYQAISDEFTAKGETARADKWMDKTATVDPQEPRGYLNLVSYYMRQERSDDAKRVLEKGLEILEKPLSKVHLLMPYYRMLKTEKKIEEAKAILQQIRELTDDERTLEWVEKEEKSLQ